jgi:hypothetical protein
MSLSSMYANMPTKKLVSYISHFEHYHSPYWRRRIAMALLSLQQRMQTRRTAMALRALQERNLTEATLSIKFQDHSMTPAPHLTH